jgi:redox-regulated HSP33 family molecular chaperone
VVGKNIPSVYQLGNKVFIILSYSAQEQMHRAGMNIKDEFLKEVFENYFQKSLGDLLPTVLTEAIRKSVVRQEFISLNKATKKYNLSRRTLYNYHERRYITLHTTEGKTFVSIVELEDHIRKNPLPRKTN